ncbi:unnamed protein product [Effrenium voratum]|uniref:EF-hand domain-containing protein n=1 Tax=Effrenium voratum TaxID=2562239 RepID=A0AA36MU36_9DINO|nr:unnamed protein product [Effrenium voratum]
MSFHHPFVPELEEPETPHAAAPEMKGVGPPPLGTLKSSKTTSSLPRALPDAPPPTVELSDAMQQLLDRVIQQHILELSMADDRVKLAYFEQRVDSVMEDSQEVSVSEMRHRRSTSIGRKKGVQQLRADQVLHAIDHDEAVEELFKADPLQEGFCADEPLHTITASKETKWERFQTFLQSTQFDMMIAAMVSVNVLWMALKLQIEGSISGYEMGIYADPPMADSSRGTWQVFQECGDAVFTGVFVLDVGVRIVALKCAFWRVWLNYVDVAVTIVSMMEVVSYWAVPVKVNAAIFRLLRIGKLARALRMLPVTNTLASLQLLVKGLTASRGMLFWSFCLLTFLQCVAGMIISTLCRDYITETTYSQEVKDVFLYYGTFSRTFLSMFEILFANWGPPARVLVDNVSEWYSLFFLLYRCVLGFAVINVVNAIFVQQTLKTASSDEELSFKQKEKDIQMYANKVKKLFQTMDFSGDGSINLEEFSKLVKSPKLKFWMSQLELEYHDLLSLFEFLDNGDGEITLTEFIEGAARLRGGAKALDIWRMETKLEVLFEEVLGILKILKVERRPSVQAKEEAASTQSIVQDVFNNSLYKHIQSTSRNRQPSTDKTAH